MVENVIVDVSEDLVADGALDMSATYLAER